MILVTCFILGIFFQDKFPVDENWVFLIIGICLLITIFTFFKSYFLFKLKPYMLGLMFFAVGIALHFFNSFSSEKRIDSQNQTIVFKISKKLNSTDKYKKYEVIAQSEKEDFNSILYIPKKSKELDFKHYYKAKVYLTQPKPPQYDFQFNYAKYLQRKNIDRQSYLSEGISSAFRNDLSWNEKILQKRLEVLQNIDQSTMSPQSREFLKGIILADRTEIDSETVRDFNTSGLMHFLAISGTHIVVIFGLFYFLCMYFLSLKLRKWVMILSLIFIWLFAAFIGFGNSVLRSCIMLSVYFIYVLLQRKSDVLHSLALSAFIILILDTQQIFDVGFQLSFMAVLGIFWLNQPILKHFPKQDNYFKKLVFNTISISVSAQLATLPLVLYYFHQFSFISILANFIIVPFSEIIIVFSFLMTGLIAFNIDFTLIDIVYDFTIKILLKGIHWFADFSMFFENIPMNLMEVLSLFVIVYLLRFAILKFNYKNSARLVMAVFVFLIIRISCNTIEYQNEEVLIHDFYKHKVFSVRKGNEVCFWVENNSNLDKITKYIINPYKSSRRLQAIEVKFFPTLTQKVVYKGKVYHIN
ncbi:ComEC/Rec2 family competence protein [Chryseobacterium sp. ERMR1:04]|uniref:ComEC/Rec2 family competence protein n=1 Tax=Chryseobacterium sp. ERMR1:04 TaxID=1705393 RepID=UPI001F51B724|nr:ComEC/Rec2 family competence protein [Chryseobacterium sp. ERMR1:04]